jgi:threonine/homoserine/homoserine lactone efflux protein
MVFFVVSVVLVLVVVAGSAFLGWMGWTAATRDAAGGPGDGRSRHRPGPVAPVPVLPGVLPRVGPNDLALAA